MLTVHAPDPNFNGQVLSVRFRDGVAQVNENAAVTLGVLRARGFRVEGDYDPAEHTVPEVVEYAEEHPDEAGQLADAEEHGEHRKGIIERLRGEE
jgi:hypothetical protein